MKYLSTAEYLLRTKNVFLYPQKYIEVVGYFLVLSIFTDFV